MDKKTSERMARMIALPARRGPKNGALRAALVALLFLGVLILSGCEVIYFPECDTQCEGTGGSDTRAIGGSA